jgi:DNA-directed RNA polymerase subunit M/transcription elongation factor TFIIS
MEVISGCGVPGNTSSNSNDEKHDIDHSDYPRNKPLNPDPLPIKYYSKPYNGFRRAKLILFNSVLKQHKEFMATSDHFSIVEKIERSCFNYTIEKAIELNVPTDWHDEYFQYLYSINCAKIASNIDLQNNVHNTYLAPAIIRGEIDIKALPRMTSQELFPEKYKSVLTKLEESKNVERTVKTTALYTCRRCKKAECIYENLYNRSLDEGVNLMITCMSCGLQWKG